MSVITPIPCLKDNLSYLIVWQHNVLLVDVPEAAPILHALKKIQRPLTGILITHGHKDHIHGLNTLAPLCKGPIYGMQHTHYPIPQVTQNIYDETPFQSHGLDIYPLLTPGHMPSHIAFHIPQLRALFSGDVLFRLGCGRVLDGSYQQLYTSLIKLAQLDDQTYIYDGHEYVLSNGLFAQQMVGHNTERTHYLTQVRASLKNGHPSPPTTIVQEKRMNPFFSLAVQARENLNSFIELRHLKDTFVPK